jgi:hypothetical protein
MICRHCTIDAYNVGSRAGPVTQTGFRQPLYISGCIGIFCLMSKYRVKQVTNNAYTAVVSIFCPVYAIAPLVGQRPVGVGGGISQ